MRSRGDVVEAGSQEPAGQQDGDALNAPLPSATRFFDGEWPHLRARQGQALFGGARLCERPSKAPLLARPLKAGVNFFDRPSPKLAPIIPPNTRKPTSIFVQLPSFAQNRSAERKTLQVRSQESSNHGCCEENEKIRYCRFYRWCICDRIYQTDHNSASCRSSEFSASVMAG